VKSRTPSKKPTSSRSARDIKRESRPRLGKFTVAEITPAEALKIYLEQKKISPNGSKELLEYGQRLIEDSNKG